jgi:hypothetical protein
MSGPAGGGWENCHMADEHICTADFFLITLVPYPYIMRIQNNWIPDTLVKKFDWT